MAASFLSFLAGLSISLGAWLASHEHIRPQWLEDELHHFIIGIGARALLSAIALVIIPQGANHHSVYFVSF